MTDLLELYGYVDRAGVVWRLGQAWEANLLLARHHYLGPLRSGARLTVIGTMDGEIVAAMMWKHPTSRRLPSDGTWLELARWCLTPAAGSSAGSRMHRWSLRLIREHYPQTTTLVSYSDPTQGHTGALYRACNWQWAPTWHRLRPPPSGSGDWGTGRQEVKDRWVFCIQRDQVRRDVLAVDDLAALRHWRASATEVERRWATRSLNLPCESPLLQAIGGGRMTAGQVELPLELDERPEVTWATQAHTHPAQMVLKRCGRTADHTSHPYMEGALNFGCDGKSPEARHCPVWSCGETHVWAISRGGIYDCGGGG